MRLYVDTSVLLRRVFVTDTRAAEAVAFLAQQHASGHVIESSIMARVEAERALRARRAAGGLPDDYDLAGAVDAVLAGVQLVAFTKEVAEVAAGLEPGGLRSLDAVHVATAILDAVDQFVTCDARQAAAAQTNSLHVIDPAT
ncbi:MAG: PIN domain-containing protein [Bifidobacteriaceae bacterium]|jgi:predicted nucleic acid-binding protein|nr:PIN domain-containing protein [Bifidobacteriaceae bacterium]